MTEFIRIKVSSLKEGDVVNRRNGKGYKVITNHKDDVLFLANEDLITFSGIHLFVDEKDDVEFAKLEFNIDLEK